ncbi:hypothetical protein [Chondromyces crocatus]|nr:hypothetical protein [Chondromyces crocatus]
MDDLVISFTDLGPSQDAVWHAFAKDLMTKGINRYLATSLGAVQVNSVQRKITADALKKRNIPTAAVTDDRLVRGLVTAVAWLGVNIKPFAWSELREAALFLKVPATKVDRIIEAAVRLRTSSG